VRGFSDPEILLNFSFPSNILNDVVGTPPPERAFHDAFFFFQSLQTGGLAPPLLSPSP